MKTQVSKYLLYQKIHIRKTSCPVLTETVELEMNYPSHILRVRRMKNFYCLVQLQGKTFSSWNV